MAAPPDMTTLDLTGTFVLNKSLSTPKEMDLILQHQGVSWVTRTAIAYATITIVVKHYKDDDAVEHIDINQTLSGGIGTSSENRIADWTPREHNDRIFGPVISKSRRAKVQEIDDDYLRKNWLPDVLEHGVINSYVVSDTEKSHKTWIAEQVWGFEEINGERRYSRHIKFTGPQEERVKALMIYDYIGPNKE